MIPTRSFLFAFTASFLGAFLLLKTPAKLKFYQMMESVAPDMMFMPIFKEQDNDTALLESMDLNYVAAELVFATEDSPLCSEEYPSMPSIAATTWYRYMPTSLP